MGADTVIAEEMTGNIEIKTAEQTKVKFNGNQTIKKNNKIGLPPKWYIDPKKGFKSMD